jgi:hypothetical protein
MTGMTVVIGVMTFHDVFLRANGVHSFPLPYLVDF